jgi:hypothetical protein
MNIEQRIKELRAMFIQLSEIILQEMKEGADVKSSETLKVLQRIQAALEKSEKERITHSNQ